MKYKKTLILCLSFIIIIPLYVIFILFWPFPIRSAKTLFKIHISREIPASVKNLNGTEKPGSGLAWHWAVVTCDISPHDAEIIIKKLKFPKFNTEDKEIEKRLLDNCRDINIEVDEIYLKTDGMSKWILIFNKEKTRIYYTYIKI